MKYVDFGSAKEARKKFKFLNFDLLNHVSRSGHFYFFNGTVVLQLQENNIFFLTLNKTEFDAHKNLSKIARLMQ